MKDINYKKLKIYGSIIALSTSVVLIHSSLLSILTDEEKKDINNISSKKISSNEVKSNNNRIDILMNGEICKVSVEDLNTRKGISGAVLSLKDSNNNIIEEWVSTDEPHYIINLSEGEYTVTEQKAPEGYEKVEDVNFTFKNNNYNNQFNSLSVLVDNEICKVSVEDLTTRKGISGAVLSLKDSNNNIIEEWVSTDEPHYITNLSEGEYTVTEQKAPEGYEKVEGVNFTFKNNNYNNINRINVLMHDEVCNIVIEDSVTGKSISGAVLSLKDTDNNIIDSWTSTEKPYYIENLTDGEYIITEQKAPEGYEKVEDITFNYKNNKSNMESKLR